VLASRRLQVPPAYLLPDLGGICGLQQVDGPTEQRRLALHDTEQLALTRWGARIEHDPAAGWRIELPRVEVAGVAEVPRAVTRVPGGTGVPSAANDLLASLTGGQPLRQLVRLDVRAEVALLVGTDEEPVVAVADEEISVTEGRRLVARFRELVLRPGSGVTPDVLEEVESHLTVAGAAVLEGGTSRPIEVFGQRAVAPPDVPPPETIGPEPSVADVVQARLRRHIHPLVLVLPHLRLHGSEEAVAVWEHALRGLRADLAVLGPMIGNAGEDLGHEVGKLLWQAERVRVPERRAATIAAAAAALDSDDDRAAVDARRRDEQQGLLRQLRDQVCEDSDVVLRLRALAMDAAVASAATAADLDAAVRDVARSRWADVVPLTGAGHRPIELLEPLETLEAAADIGRLLDATGARRLHKRLRRYLHAQRRVQEALEAATWLRDQATVVDHPAFSFLAGRLSGAVEVAGLEARGRAAAAWERLGDTKTRRWLAR